MWRPTDEETVTSKHLWSSPHTPNWAICTRVYRHGSLFILFAESICVVLGCHLSLLYSGVWVLRVTGVACRAMAQARRVAVQALVPRRGRTRGMIVICVRGAVSVFVGGPPRPRRKRIWTWSQYLPGGTT
jgi:hypothetical protein